MYLFVCLCVCLCRAISLNVLNENDGTVLQCSTILIHLYWHALDIYSNYTVKAICGPSLQMKSSGMKISTTIFDFLPVCVSEVNFRRCSVSDLWH